MTSGNDLWTRVLLAAETKVNNAYTATFHDRRHISIVDQQARSLNLCYALSKTGRVTRASHVAIVGCGLSGMTCAVALAMLRDCTVYVFERDRVLLRKFSEAAFRYLHPDLNHLGAEGSGLQYDPSKRTYLPFMNWSGGYGPEVAAELTNKFDHYRSVTNIALRTNADVVAIRARKTDVCVILRDGVAMPFDAIIVATGFGNELTDDRTNDASYWHSGNPRHYRPVGLRSKRLPERVLISGNGDSGVIELAHFMIKNFNHRDVFSFLPSNDIAPRLGNAFSAAIESLAFRRIENAESDDSGNTGPIAWYWKMREILENNPGLEFFGSDSVGQRHADIYGLVHARLHRVGPDDEIPPPTIAAIDKELRPVLDSWASHEIRDLVNGFRMEKIYSARIRRAFRNKIRVTIIGRTPFIYSSRRSALNWFLLRVLEQYGQFEYQQGGLVDSSLEEKGTRVILKLANGRRVTRRFDRVVARHGPDFNVLGYSNALVQRRLPQNLATGYLMSDWVLRHTEGRYRDRVFEECRSPRWRRAVEHSAPFDDSRWLEMGSAIFAGSFIAHADAMLIGGRAAHTRETMAALYRQFKRAKSGRAQLRVLAMMNTLDSKGTKR